MATLGVAIVGVILINGVFSFWQTYRAERALAALKKLLPNTTKVVRCGAVRQVPAAELVPGDVILLEAGDILPADCRLVQAFSVRVNNATVTGESLPLSRDAEPCDEPDPMHGRNTLLAGTSLVSGEAKALVFATGSHSAFGRIATLTQATDDTISPLQIEIVRVSRIVAGLALALGRGLLLRRPGDRAAILGNFHFRHWHNRRERAGGPAADRYARACHGFATYGETQRADSPSAGGRSARLHHGHLHRQDRHAYPELHVCETLFHRWANARDHPRATRITDRAASPLF